MKTIFAALLATSLLTAAARADVFIYRGIDKISTDLASAALFGNSLNVYLVVDYSGAQYGSVIFGRLAGGKHFTKTSANTVNFTSVSLPKGRTGSVFVSAAANNNTPADFYNFALLFRGTDQSLLIRRTPTVNLVNRPNVLKGTGVSVSANSGIGSQFIDQHFGLTFQGTKTIKANNASKTADQVLDDLAAELTAKGFTSL